MVKVYEKVSKHSCSSLMQDHMVGNAKKNLNVTFLLYFGNDNFGMIMGETLYCAILVYAW